MSQHIEFTNAGPVATITLARPEQATDRGARSGPRLEAIRALALPQTMARLSAQSIEPAPASSEAFGAFIARETEKWARVVGTAGVKSE